MPFSVSYIYQIIDKYTRPIRKIQKGTDKAQKSLKKAAISAKNFGQKMANLQTGMAAFAGTMAAVLPAKAAMEFEDVMTDVLKVVDFASRKEFAGFKREIFLTSAALGKLPKDIGQIAVAGGKLGIPRKELTNFIGVVSKTSVAFDMLESTAGEQLASIKSKLALTIDETANLMDAINFLADNTAAGGSRMIEIVARTSGTFKTIKMPEQLIAGWAAFADQVEVTPQLAASGLKMMVNRMMKMPGMMEKLLKDPNKTIREFLGRFSALDPAKRAVTIFKVFGDEAGRFVLKAVGNTKLLDDTLGKVSGKAAFAGSMMRELEKKLKTGKTAWARILAVLNIVAITIGNAMLPAIKWIAPLIVKAALAFRDFSMAHPGLTKILAIVLALVAVIGPLLIFLGLASTAIGGIATVLGAVVGPVLAVVAGITALVASLAALWMYKDKVGGFFKDVWGVIAGGPISGVSARGAAATKGTLDGSIKVSAAKGSRIEEAGMSTTMPGKLGFNIAGM